MQEEIDFEDAGKVDLLEFGERLDEEGENPLFSALRSCARLMLMSRASVSPSQGTTVVRALP